MSIVVIDAGHGGSDPGGRSLGRPEKQIALSYAILLAAMLRQRFHRVILTRTEDVYVNLSVRARIANEVRADLFVSVHANASDNADARGPWTLHAKGSARGRAIASSVQAALVSVFGGNDLAVYPDGEGWTGGRTLAVLRQTRMPAVLLELGFMTNERDIRLMTDTAAQGRACALLALAIDAELGGVPGQPIPRIRPEVVKPDRTPPLLLEKIHVPRPEHVEEIVRAHRLTDEAARAGLQVAEVLLRGVARGQVVPTKKDVMKAAADALADFLKGRSN